MSSAAKADTHRSVPDRLTLAQYLFFVGAVLAVGTGVVGYIWLNSVPDLHPVSLGEQAAITATGSDTATIFTPSGLGIAPSCRVTAVDGTRVALAEPDRYQQSDGLEATYGFPVTSTTTYTVLCGDRDQAGQFAVAETSGFPEGFFVTVGTFGIAICVAGGTFAWRARTPGPRHADARPTPR